MESSKIYDGAWMGIESCTRLLPTKFWLTLGRRKKIKYFFKKINNLK